jgi:type IV pilus assembly protein PilC
MTYVVPSFTRTYVEAGTRLPEITALLITVSTALKNNVLYILLVAAAAVVGYQYIKQTDRGRHYLDQRKLKVPFLGGIYVNYAVSKLARTLATVLGGGLTLVNAIRISSGSLDNSHLKAKLEEAADAVEKGAGFSESLANTGAFPSLAVRMMEAGESSGALGQVLDDVADFYESDVDTKLSILTSSIEPALMVVMGLLIGFIVLAMYMPIFQMAATVG